jgi:hypothetical protein
LRTREATCSSRWSAAPVADFSCAAAPLAVRLERDCVPLEREPLDRPLLERAPLEPDPLARDPLARDPLERDPLERELDARLEPDELLDERRLPDDELDLEPPLLACGTSPPLHRQRFSPDSTFHRGSVGRGRVRALERHSLEC